MDTHLSARSISGHSRRWALLTSIALLTVGGPVFAAQLSVSTSPARSAAVPLQGATLAPGNIYIFAPPESGLRQVVFYLDPPATGGTPARTEGIAPFDFAGTDYYNNAIPLATSSLSAGSHTVKGVFTYQTGATQTVVSTFSIGTPPPPPPPPSDPGYSLQVSSSANRANAAQLGGSTLTGNPAYIFLSPSTGVRRVDFYLDNASTPTSNETIAPLDFAHTAGDNVNALPWDPASLANGVHALTAVVTPTSGSVQTLISAFTVSAGGVPPTDPPPGPVPGGDRCAPSICTQIRVALPFALEFNGEAGHLVDAASIGTGFTYVLPSSKATSYTPGLVRLDGGRSALAVQTTAGIATTTANNHTNMLGVGFTGQAQTARISTRIVTPPNGTGKFEQAGLWFGYGEENYFKIVYESTPAGNVIEFMQEFAGKSVKSFSVNVPSAAASSVSLDLIVNPYNQQVSGFYALGNNDTQQIGTAIAAAPEFFSFDAAGIDPEIGTRSFAGIFASHRNATSARTYLFDSFGIAAIATAPPVGQQLSFTRKSYGISNPTNVVWGPDNRLYVTEMFGKIHALTFDANLNVTQDQVINSLVALNGSRLTLGITVDPESTANNVTLWVSSSSPSTDNGALNSSMITKLSGPGFASAQNVITGLPRAISNHAPNSLHFGGDGRLYLAIGGNTGTGAPANVPNEFGDRPEQQLSAALVVANVKAPGFNGNCAPATIYAAAPCDVTAYATGLRNSYDFVFHSNGQLYATDNGLGVAGAFPPSPQAPCFGVADARAWNNGGQNPGTQPDLLHRIEAGRYYGHPNPSRGQCVFKDGSYQGVAPLSNYTPPFAVLGEHLSANGITEYTSTAACGLQGSLLIANYSLGQNISRVKLAAGGRSVESIGTLVSGLAGPLGITTNPAGVIFVTEMNNGAVTALRYSGSACN